MKLQLGHIAPDFSLCDQTGKIHTLAQHRGQWVLLYFYPKDATPGCTVEACGIRDQFSAFKKSKLVVLGVSTDSVKSHEKFATKHKLPFALLADTDKEVVNKYDVWAKKKFMGHEYIGTLRMSYLIDPKGLVAKIYEKVTPAAHASEVLSDLKSLAK